MTELAVPKMSKWPFVVGDVLLLAVAWWIVQRQAPPLGAVALILLCACVGVGAWLLAVPFRADYQAALKLREANLLAEAAATLRNLEAVQTEISQATASWHAMQEHSEKTSAACRDMAERMTSEAKGFREFMHRANDSEKNHLRLEVEKLRRAEAEWLQTTVHLLDHVYALYCAGARAGQPALHEQLANFQKACREIVRRHGLQPIEGQIGERYDANRHKAANLDANPTANSLVAETLATGYGYQGQVIRLPLVRIETPPMPEGGSCRPAQPNLESGQGRSE